MRLSSGADRLHLPCVHPGPKVGVLPTFGAFTGGVDMRAGAGERIFIIAEDAVEGLPPARSWRRARS
ncbi:hypothetical protein [Cystobacter fuscus]|uniref:hypothetical protein n=1 Tax=Cystobacter fuscus TaxID=43 RepID=UPI0037C0A2EC